MLAYIRLKKYLILHPFFMEELSIYVPGRVVLRSLYIKKASAAEKFGGLTTLSGTALRARLRKVESNI